VFSKAHNAAPPPAARPNVLLGHWPGNGPGANDHYEVYGNFFYQNPHEALFQGEGNLALYNNLFVNEYGDAIHIQPHNDIPKTIDIFFNTVLAGNRGIVIQSGLGSMAYRQSVVANAVFAAVPLTGGQQRDNFTGKPVDAAQSLLQPQGQPGELDLHPRQDQLQGNTVETTGLRNYGNWLQDFDGNPRDLTYRGAYGTDQSSPGWNPALEIKPAAEAGPATNHHY
jgi:hypothetical protein